MWGGGRIRMAVGLGVPIGLMWLLVDDQGHSILPLVVSLVVSGLVGGAIVAIFLTGRSPRLADLDPVDRVAVLDAVRTGDRVADPRLAPAVIERTEALGRVARTFRRDRLLVGLVLLGVLVWAIVMTFDGLDLGDRGPWLLLMFGVVGMISGARRAPARFANAERADRYAREVLGAG